MTDKTLKDPTTGQIIDLNIPGNTVANDPISSPVPSTSGVNVGDNPHTPNPVDRSLENKSVDFEQPTTQPATGASPTDAPNIGSSNDAAKNPGMPTPGEVASEKAKEALVSGDGRLSEGNKALKERLREGAEGRETEGVTSTISDNDEVRHANADTPPVLKDGREAHYIAGRRVLITPKQKEQFIALQKQVDEALGDAPVGELAVSHPYHAKRKELDAFVATLI